MSTRAKRTGSRRLALDANLLILWVTGLYKRDDVGRTKPTGAYKPEQFDQLDELLLPYIESPLSQIVVTPNVVTECSNLLDSSRPKDGKSPRGQVLKELIAQKAVVVEDYVPSAKAMSLDEYRYLGVSDCALLSLVDEKTALLTEDAELAYKAMVINRDSKCFGQIREDIHGRQR